MPCFFAILLLYYYCFKSIIFACEYLRKLINARALYHMKVKDVMSPQVDYVTTDTKVRDVCRVIFGRGINGVPVCKGKKVIGFITERDILAKFYPSMQEYMEDPTSSSDFEGMEGKVSEIFELTAKDIMSNNPTKVFADTPLLRAQSLMAVHKVGRLPIVDKKENLIGILSKGDIFRATVGDRLELAQDEEYNDWLSKRYYLTVNWKNRLSLEIPDLVKVLRQNKVERIVDIGCGTGEHVIELAKHGFTVWGIERSKLMIDEANKKIKNLPKRVASKVKFITGEYEELLPELTKVELQAALILGNSISHNPYNYKSVIKKTEQVLSGNKVMIFQIENFEKVFKKQNSLLDFIRVKADYQASPYQEHVFLEYLDPSRDGGKTILKTFAIFDFDGRKWKFYGLRNILFAYVIKEKIEKILRESGYKNIKFYGSSYDGREWNYLFRKPFKPLESDWLNVVAKR